MNSLVFVVENQCDNFRDSLRRQSRRRIVFVEFQQLLVGQVIGMVRFDDHTAFTYGKPGFENPFFIAYAPGVELKPG